MGFTFSLDPVLRVRELAADREEALLAGVLAELAGCRDALAHCRIEFDELAVSREQAFAGGAIQAMYMQGSYAESAAVQARAVAFEKEIGILEERRVAQIARYGEAHRRRELLVNLRKTARENWIREQNKREAKAADEMFLNKWLRDSRAD